MEKNILLLHDDFKNDVVKLINKSKLPVFIVEYVLKDILNEVHMVNQQQLQNEKITYDTLLKTNETNSSD